MCRLSLARHTTRKPRRPSCPFCDPLGCSGPRLLPLLRSRSLSGSWSLGKNACSCVCGGCPRWEECGGYTDVFKMNFVARVPASFFLRDPLPAAPRVWGENSFAFFPSQPEAMMGISYRCTIAMALASLSGSQAFICGGCGVLGSTPSTTTPHLSSSFGHRGSTSSIDGRRTGALLMSEMAEDYPSDTGDDRFSAGGEYSSVQAA